MKLKLRKNPKHNVSLFVCPFCTLFKTSLHEFISHLKKDHSDAAITAFAEQQEVPQIKPTQQDNLPS